MARGGLAKWGYPSAAELRNQAGQIADASVPSVSATTLPYTHQHQSVGGFLQGVLAALSDSRGEVADAYSDAYGQQQALDAAALARLNSLGLGQFSAGAQAAQGARGDSAAAQLLSQGASARNYIAKAPGIATGFAQTQNSAINKALSEALAQRTTARSQAFSQALQTVQQNALQRADFLAARQEAAQNLALQYAQLNQSQSQFQASQAQANADRAQAESQWRQEFIAQYGWDPTTGKKVKGTGSASGGMGDLTPAETRQQMSSAWDILHPKPQQSKIPKYGPAGHLIGYTIKPDKNADTRDFAQKGIAFGDAIDMVMSQGGVIRPVAMLQVARLYRGYSNIAPPHWDQKTHKWLQQPAYHSYVSYLQWLRDHHVDRSTPIHDVAGH